MSSTFYGNLLSTYKKALCYNPLEENDYQAVGKILTFSNRKQSQWLVEQCSVYQQFVLRLRKKHPHIELCVSPWSWFTFLYVLVSYIHLQWLSVTRKGVVISDLGLLALTRCSLALVDSRQSVYIHMCSSVKDKYKLMLQ